MKVEAVRLMVSTAVFSLFLTLAVHAQTLEELDAQRVQARQNYDLEGSRVIFERLKTFVEASSSDAANLSLAYSALAVAELQRIVFEEEAPTPLEQRTMGKIIDAAANAGHVSLESLPDTSEKYRIRADLYGMMIRTNYQGKRYEKRMTTAKDMALELDPDNPDAQVTGSKRLLFAKKRRGGDIQEAMFHLNRALELEESHVMALVLRGFAHEKLEDYVAAKADWNRALELNPLCKPAKDNLLRLVDEGH